MRPFDRVVRQSLAVQHSLWFVRTFVFVRAFVLIRLSSSRVSRPRPEKCHRPTIACLSSLLARPMDLDDLERLGELSDVGASGEVAGLASPAMVAPLVVVVDSDADEDDCDVVQIVDRPGGAAGHDEAAAGGLNLVDIDALGQLGQRHQPALKRQHAWRSADAMAHARAGLEKKRRREQDAVTQAKLADQEQHLASVRENFPAVASALRLSHGQAPSGSAGASGSDCGSMTRSRAAALVRASFEQVVRRGLGVRHERLLAFSADLCLTLQKKHLALFLQKCAWFRMSCGPSVQHVVVLGYSHESDGTSQAISQRVLQSIGRPSSQRLPTEVVNQQGSFRARLLRISRETGEVCDETSLTEPWQCTSLVVLEKTAQFVLRAMQQVFPFDMSQPGWPEAWGELLVSACDRFVVDQHCDKASSNAPALKHIACCLAEVAPCTLHDTSVCELHVLHNLKCGGPGTKKDVGKMFSLRNVHSIGSFHYGLVHSIVHLSHTTVQRNVSPPPAGACESDLALLADALFDTKAAHHQRGGLPSTLLEDLRALAEVPLHEVPGQQARVHYCWCPRTQKACCSSDDACCEKVAVAHVNMFASRAFEDVALSRFTNVSKARKILLFGMTNQRLYLSAVAFVASKGVDRDDPDSTIIPTLSAPEELGAGESDLQVTHRVRCTRIHAWLSFRQFYYSIGVAEITEAPLERLQYAIFGHNKEHINLAGMLDRRTSPIGVCMRELTALLTDWSPSKGGAWKVLFLCGWTDFTSHEVRLYARGSALHLLSGVSMQYDRKISELPWTLHTLTSDDRTVEEKEAFCGDLLATRGCDMPLFAREFVHHFPTVAAMLSEEAAATLRVWADGKKFSTKGSELGHASERRFLAPSGAPGKSLLHHARRHLLHKVRLSHMAKGGTDPLSKAVVRQSARSASSTDIAANALGNALPARAPDVFAGVLPAQKLAELKAGTTGDISEAALRDMARDIRSHVALPAPAPLPTIAAGAAGAAPPPAHATSASPASAGALARSGAAKKRSGKGLNPYFVFLNRARHEYKLTVGAGP